MKAIVTIDFESVSEGQPTKEDIERAIKGELEESSLGHSVGGAWKTKTGSLWIENLTVQAIKIEED